MEQATAIMPLKDVLNRQIANWSIMYVKLHNYHWFVTGENFYELHAKFEELYNEAAANIDELAERLLAVGGTPVATMKEFLEHASISEATGRETTREMVENIADDFQRMISELKEAIDIAEQDKDQSSADLFTQIRTSLEKHVWMLHSFLEK